MPLIQIEGKECRMKYIKEHYDEVASDPSAFYDNVLDQ